MLYILLIVFFLFIMCSSYEYFGSCSGLGCGKSFSRYYSPEKCLTQNNCFKGSYCRSQVYQDVCQPQGQLNRVKKSLRTDCVKQL